MRIKSSVNKQW